MINQEKVKDMTKMAIYESHGGDKELTISAYRRKDYVAIQMIKSFLFGTISYLIICIFIFLSNVERFEAMTDVTQFQRLGVLALVFYGVFMAAFLIGTYIWARKKHKYCTEQAQSYSTDLNRVARSYQNSEEETESISEN